MIGPSALVSRLASLCVRSSLPTSWEDMQMQTSTSDPSSASATSRAPSGEMPTLEVLFAYLEHPADCACAACWLNVDDKAELNLLFGNDDANFEGDLPLRVLAHGDGNDGDAAQVSQATRPVAATLELAEPAGEPEPSEFAVHESGATHTFDSGGSDNGDAVAVDGREGHGGDGQDAAADSDGDELPALVPDAAASRPQPDHQPEVSVAMSGPSGPASAAAAAPSGPSSSTSSWWSGPSGNVRADAGRMVDLDPTSSTSGGSLGTHVPHSGRHVERAQPNERMDIDVAVHFVVEKYRCAECGMISQVYPLPLSYNSGLRFCERACRLAHGSNTSELRRHRGSVATRNVRIQTIRCFHDHQMLS